MERNQKVYVKVLQLKQNPQNGRTDYSLSMRAVNQQTGVEQSTVTATAAMQYQQRQQPPPQQQQQQQQDRQQLRVNGTTRILPSGYSGSKANMIPLGKKEISALCQQIAQMVVLAIIFRQVIQHININNQHNLP